jgi:hypothetical protein
MTTEPTYRNLGPEDGEVPAKPRGRHFIAVIGIDKYAHWPRGGTVPAVVRTGARGTRRESLAVRGVVESPRVDSARHGQVRRRRAQFLKAQYIQEGRSAATTHSMPTSWPTWDGWGTHAAAMPTPSGGIPMRWRSTAARGTAPDRRRDVDGPGQVHRGHRPTSVGARCCSRRLRWTRA